MTINIFPYTAFRQKADIAHFCIGLLKETVFGIWLSDPPYDAHAHKSLSLPKEKGIWAMAMTRKRRSWREQEQEERNGIRGRRSREKQQQQPAESPSDAPGAGDWASDSQNSERKATWTDERDRPISTATRNKLVNPKVLW